MSTLTTDRIRDTATRLGLTHLTETVTDLVERAEANQMGYLDFLDLLLAEELGIKEGRRFRNALKLSGLPHHKTLDEFDFAFQPDLDPRKIRDLATLEFVTAKANVALLGPPGVGKTMIAVALAVAACQAGFSIYYTTLDDLVRKLRTAETAGRFNRQLTAFLRPAALVVDEVGYLPPQPRRGKHGLPTHLTPLRTRLDHHHLQQVLRRMGQRLGRRRTRHRHPRPTPPPLRRRHHQRPQLPPQRPHRPRHRR